MNPTSMKILREAWARLEPVDELEKAERIVVVKQALRAAQERNRLLDEARTVTPEMAHTTMTI
ncbi:MAG: hypothetical protein Q7R54_02770 [bacterium]|nr:hypothetical protein [bacterium]